MKISCYSDDSHETRGMSYGHKVVYKQVMRRRNNLNNTGRNSAPNERKYESSALLQLTRVTSNSNNLFWHLTYYSIMQCSGVLQVLKLQ